ncbi:sarcosine oxidase subunit beta family protein [Aliamphritea ceti]|uniref:sarcosine oxidase subunit beta family protein n=1 Tax=Aliamphritea ceti TaxID=1524258 RepID=UPI0021C46B23|nr:sarcosine oxidase subunit beta family protein [Aliamphritea ceti]
MQRYSIFNLIRHALGYHRGWQSNWRTPTPKDHYDIIIVGGGGHGLATAYYLAKKHGINRVAVIEKGWLGGGNTGRNTTIVRSNYLYDESSALFEHAMKLWEGLSQELNYNVMFSQRGLMHLAHNEHDLHEITRRCHAIRMNGIDSEILTPQQIKQQVPMINLDVRFPVLGALYQGRAGTARHDAVAWGYARGADDLGVDIIQNCEVLGFDIQNNEVRGVHTTQGLIRASKVGCVAAGNSSVLAAQAGLKLPLESATLQAFVSEPLKPMLNSVVTSNTVHCYVSQSDKGELVIGGSSDPYNSYSQRGGFDQIEHVVGPMAELYPIISRLKMMRQWGGTVDLAPDRSPILGESSIRNLYFNCGWGTGGFKATPGSGDLFADSLAKDRMHPILKPFGLERFASGELIDEGAAAGVAH